MALHRRRAWVVSQPGALVVVLLAVSYRRASLGCIDSKRLALSLYRIGDGLKRSKAIMGTKYSDSAYLRYDSFKKKRYKDCRRPPIHDEIFPLSVLGAVRL